MKRFRVILTSGISFLVWGNSEVTSIHYKWTISGKFNANDFIKLLADEYEVEEI